MGEKVVKRTLEEIILKSGENALSLYGEHTRLFINPAGRFVIGGPQGDAGLTGRKIIIDTYGGWGAHGGGAFSGKDPTKVDRSGAYQCRQMAKYVKLREPKYLKTAAYSHFGREPYVEDGLSYFEWERVKDLSKYAGMSRDEIWVAMQESDHLSRWVA